MEASNVLLVGCVKTKRSYPCAARDLYFSALFRKQRRYAESSGLPWFILSAEYGLVAPNEWLSPYERFLPSTPRDYQLAWGIWVAARLELLAGPLAQRTIEIHASNRYIQTLRPHLEDRGAEIVDPLRGLKLGPRLAWYQSNTADYGPDSKCRTSGGDGPVLARLLDETDAVTPDEFLAAGRIAADKPGLYSWWVDDAGAADLGEGLGVGVSPGLIYAGLAGATRWPSGKRSSNTLWLRIATMHLGGNHEFSTFRRTLGVILAARQKTTQINEQYLTEWMSAHLRLVAVPFDDRDELGRLEERLLAAMDPPLNLKGMESTPVRIRIKALRTAIARDS